MVFVVFIGFILFNIRIIIFLLLFLLVFYCFFFYTVSVIGYSAVDAAH
jgi:hypothetical protein